MKKTLAVILAAAMAASMSTVVFARDFQDNDAGYNDNASGSSGSTKWIVLGKDDTYYVSVDSVELRDDLLHDFSTEQLASMIENNLLSASVVVTSGKDKLSSMPTVKVVGNQVQLKVAFKDTWGVERHKDDGGDPSVSAKLYVKFTAKKDIYEDSQLVNGYILSYVDATTGAECIVNDTGAKDIDDGFLIWDGTCIGPKADAHVYTSKKDVNKAKDALEKKYNGLKVTVKVVDGVAGDSNKEAILKKGDTITCSTLTVKAGYHDVTEYGDTLTVTPTEVSGRFIVADGEDLYDNAGSGDNVTMYFGPTGDVASFNFKVSSAQKDLNLAYNLNEIQDVVDAYPGVDFEFIRFESRTHNVLTNGAIGTFNAIGGKNTTVYEWDGKTLTELPTKYNSMDNTVETTEKLKRLTAYVVSEVELVAETKATEAVTEPIVEPEPDAPATEAPAPSAPSNNDNPTTGAL